MFFAFAGKEAAANSAENTGLTPSSEKRQLAVQYTEEKSSPVFTPLTSTVLQAAATITSTATGGDWSKPATWKNGIVPGAGDDVIIANGATVTIDTDTPALGSLTIGQGTSGILQYDAIAERTVTVSGIVTINSGGTFRSAPPTTAGTTKDNLLVVGVSLINNGTIDFCIQSSGAGIKFIGTTTGNSMFNCEGSAKTNLQETNGVILEMDNPGKTLLFYPGADFKVCSTTAKGFLTIVSGIFKLASGAIPFSNPVFSSTSYTIPAAGGFELSNANATITGQNGTVTNQGKIIVSAGTYNIGTATGNSSLTSNDGTFAQSGGTINIAGRFKISGGNCNISGGTMNIATIGYADAREAAFHIAKEANLNIYGAPLITFTYPHSNTVPFSDIYIESGKLKSIAGGTFQMGTAATPEVSTFFVNSEIPLDRITVFNECAIRVVNTSEGLIANTVNGTFDKVVMPLSPPESIAVICNETIPAAYTNLQAFTEDGGKAMYNCTLLPASFKFVGQTQSGTSCPYTITRTYQVTDIFGSTGTTQHLIFVEDEATEPPPEAVVEPAKEEEVVKLKSATGILAVPTATISGNATICGDGSVTPITISLTGTQPWAITYQRDGANDITVTGIISSPYSFNVSIAGTYTISAVSDADDDGTGTFSGSAVVIVDPLPTANAGSAMTAICQGGTSATLDGTVGGSATGGTWSSSAGGAFSPNASLNATWTPPTGYYGIATFTLTTTGGSCSPATDSKTIEVLQMPTITVQPDDVLDCEDRSVNFKVVATGTITGYTWQRMKPLGSFLDIPDGESGITYPSTGEIKIDNVGGNNNPHGSKYRVIVRNGICSVTSTEATLTVNEITNLTGGTDVTQCSGTNYSYTVTTSYPALTYQWKKSVTSGVWTDISNGGAYSGANTNQLTIAGGSPAESGSYRVYMTFDATGADCNVTSDTRNRKLTFLPALTVPVITNPQPICYNTASAQLTATAATGGSGTTYSYQWQSSSDNLTWSNVGTNSLTYQPPVLTSSTYYRIIASDAGTYDCGTATSTSVLITVNPTPTLSGASQAAAVCAGSAATINLTGLLANSTSTIAYTINGAAQTPVTGIAANGLGAASFTTPSLTAANNGQTLQITGITTTSLTPNCNQSFTQNVTLVVNSAPVITSCPSPTIALNTSAGVCTAVGTYSVEASGQPVPTFTYTFTGATTGTGAGTGTGSTFNAGTTNVTVTATNSCGNVACNFSVTVTDNVLPVITNCPTDITVYTGIGSITCEQTATWTAPAATDNCTATGSLVWTNTHSPGATFPVGTTIVTYTVKDASNNTATCTFNVIVIDNTKPIFNAPGEAFINVDASCNVSVLPTFTGNVSGLFDNCTIPANLVVTYIDGVSSPAGAGCAYPYSFTRTWRVTDAAGNFEEKTQSITVRDLIKPVISVPANIARSCEQSILPAETGTATAIDNCPGTVTIAYTDATAAGSCAGNSVITRTWSATDCSGNISTGVQLITVSDGINPTATAPPYPIATCPSTIPFAYADYTEFVSAGGTASDNCGPVTVVLYDEIANGLEGKPGYCPTSLTRTYRVTDQCGNYTDVVQTVNIAGECGCSPCTTGTNFHLVDMLNDPTGTILLEDQIRNGKCCDAKSNEDCISFNVRIDDDAVGVEILIEGAAPSPQDWRIDCTGINMSDGIVCIPGGAFHLFTFCKPGQNANDFTFRSIPGIIASSDINARVDCSGQLDVTGIASNPVWTSISPGVEGEYNSYLSSTTILNPIFTAPAGAPPVIQYQICGNIGSTVCNALGTDCDVISVSVKEEINLNWNIDPTLVCENNIPTFVADISPAGATYTYEWYSGYGATGTLLHSGSNSYKPLVAGPYSLRVTDTQNGIPCSTQIFDFDVIFDTTGAAVFSPPNDLTIECNASNASTLIQNWLASAVAEDEDGNPLPVTTDYNGITMACGTDLLVTFSASDHCGNIGTATKHIFVIDTQVPTWLTAAGYLNRTLSCSDAAGIATAQALAPVATDVCDPTLTLTKTTGAFVAGTCPNAGTYTNTWIAEDDCLNPVTNKNTSTVYTQTITITDTTPPAITTPAANQTVECDGSGNTVALNAWLTNHGGAVATDACGGTITWTNSSPVFSDLCSATGSATVTFTATDVCGNQSTTQAIFIISDTQGPSITCPATATGTTDNNECFSTTVVLGTPVVSDVCGGAINVTNNAPVQYPVGNTIVTWTATDACGNSNTCNQTVTVTDNNQPPTIVCPANVVQTADPGNCFLNNVVIPNPAIADNCAVTKLTWTMTGVTAGTSPATGVNYVGGETFNVGITTVTYIAYDAAGNASQPCSFDVWIKDLVKPVLTAECPADVTTTADPGICTAAVTVLAPAITDPCNETFTVVNSFNGTGNASGNYPVGTTSVVWTITDFSGNITTCTQTVTVSDNQNPVFVSCPANQEEQIINGGCNKTGITITEPTFSDNCGIDRLTWTMSGATTGSSPATGINYVTSQIFNIGITTVTYTLVDANNLSVTCTFTVWMKNLISPQFAATCPGDVSAVATNLRCDAVVNVPPPTISNPCNELYTVTNNSPFKTSDTDASGTYPVGSTSFTWTVTDASGNVKLCPQTVTVTDTQAPVFTLCPANQSEEIINGGCDKTSITIIDPTFTDNCGIDRLTWTMSGATTSSSAVTGLNYVNGEIFNIGITLVTYTVTDVNGLSETCSFTVWMKNLISPQFAATCPGDVSAVATNLRCDAVVNVPPPTISNPCNELYTVTNNSPFKTSDTDASGTYPVGSTSFTWTVTDASGNVKLCPQTVTVTDTQAPVFTLCPANQSEEIINGGCDKTSITLINPTFTDNCGIDRLTWTMSGATTRSSAVTGLNYVNGEIFNIGITLVTYTVTDVNGLSETCSFTVWMKNLISPQFAALCPVNVSVPADAGLCNANVTVPAPAITNPCNEAYTMVNDFNGTNNASGIYPIGTTTVHWTITDASGNIITCTQTVTVNDLPLVCPDPIIRPADFGQTYATNVIVPPPGFSNNCTGLTLIWSMVLPDASTLASPLSGINIVPSPGTFNVGVTTVTYTLTHATSVTESCSFTVTVTAKPDITCLTDITHTADPGECNYTVNPGTPTLVEGAQPITWTYTIGEGTPVTFVGSVANPGPPAIGLYDFPVGTTTINWTATNDSGTDACTQTITVTDDEAPTFTLTATVVSYCVNNIFSAVYNPNPTPLIIPEYDDITTPRPEYYTITAASKLLDLDATINNFNDNCCADNLLILHWEIIFAPTPNPATVAHELITKPAVLNQTGQPSAYGDIDFPGDGVTFLDVIHQINYWLEDCHGNPTINPNIQTVNIVITPRPNVVKVP